MRHLFSTGLFQLILLALIAPGYLFGETLLMESGEIIRGRITLEDQNTIIVETEAGTRSFEKKDVRKVFYSKVQEDNWNEQNTRNESPEAKNALRQSRASTAWDLQWSAAAGNLLLPGYAQWQRGERVKSSVYAIAALASLAALHKTDRRYRSTRNDYNTVADTLFVWPGSFTQSLIYAYQLSRENQLYSRVKIQGVRRHQASLVFLSFYAIQLLDALFVGSSFFSSAPEQTPNTGAFRFEFLPEATENRARIFIPQSVSGEFRFSFVGVL